ncbi:kinesin-like protein KIF20B [Engraulis encrasicolus]|uniref:kinesin-like protein KIF20B n=1 Tax=Engraulis encrasicolus TaxID=184585 RepID=UPI002FD6EB8B
MMESCLNGKPERATAITVEDLKRNLSDDFSDISSLSQDSLSDKEHLQVYLRVRPFTNSEQEAGESQGCVEVQGPDTVVFKAPRISLPGRLSEKPVQTGQKFRFSQVYGPETTQRQMFEGAAKGLVKDVLEGGNSLVFTYGVTNAGKTFTFLGPESDGGIVPRSLRVIFQSIEGRIYTQNNIKPHRCMDFTRLTKLQQDEESTSKRSLLKRLKETDAQKSLTCKTLLEGSTSSDIDMQSEEECVSLDADPNMKFSVWVSFCEIYNESIHDLLEVLPSGPPRRTALRLSQDVKGNTFVKDLKWIQVNSAEEAYRVLKIGRRNQSFSSTKLNTLSSRSHSIFSIRILRVEDVGVPRVLTISELSLCDLAGSERCAKTQNRGERLKEAGNINTSLLTLGKCITALRLNQTQPKFQAHIPFRESKLTHYLQGFFCGRGKACMIVNINQCASMYDETLNVLKFSAVAQKVVVLSTRPPAPEPKKSGREVSFIINEADRHHLWGRRRSTLIAWETTLEDVQEDEASEEEEEDEEEEEESADETMAEGTVLEAGEEEEDDSRHEEVKELRRKLAQQQAEKLALECRIREEVTSEFMELFSKMESDYNERLQKEKEIIEERAEHRLEILKELVKKNASEFAEVAKEESSKEERMEFMDNMLAAMRSDLAKIKQDAEQAQTMLVVADGAGTPRATVSAATETEAVTELRKQLDEMAEELLTRQQLLGIKSTELERVQAKAERSTEHLLEIQENYERQTVKVQELMAMCQQKDEMMAKLQEALDHSVEATTKDRSLIDSIREEILRFRQSCRCGANDEASDLRQNDDTVSMRAELGRLRAESVAKDQRQREASQRLYSMEQTAQELQAALADETQLHEATLTSLEKERQEMAALEADRNAVAEDRDRLKIANDELRSKVVAVETEKADVEAGWKVLAEERDRLRAENEALADDAQLHNATLASLEKERQEMAALETNRNALAEDCDRLKITNDELKSKLDAAETEAASLKATNDELRSKMDAAETKMATLEADRNSLAEERDRLKATSDELRSKVDAAETETASLKADRNTLAEERDRLNVANAELTSKVDEAEKEVKGRSKDSAKVDDELRAAQALANRHEEDALEKSKMAAALEKDVERLKAEVEALQASHLQAQASNGSGDGNNGSGGASDGQAFGEALTGLQQECESLALQSREKRERIRELEKELEDARLQMQQLEEVCGELEALCEHQQREAQSLQSQLEAERSALATAQRGHADLLQETQGLREQLSQAKEKEETRRASREQQQEPAAELPEETREGLLQEARERVAELERRLQEADTQRSSLEEKLREAQSQDGGTTRGGGGEDQQGAETAGMQKLLTQHGANMEALAKELSERKEQVQENLEVIRSLGQDLKLRDRDIAWLRERLRERESEIEQLLYKISRINDENSALQRRVSDTERLKNEAMRLKDQTILQMTTDQPSTLADSPHPSSKVSPDLPIKEQIIQHLRSRLTEQISPAQQEELLDAKLKEVESLTAELMSLKECCRQEGVSVNSGVSRSELSDGRPDETTRLKMEVPVPAAAAPELGSSRSRSHGPAEEQTPQQTSSPVGNQAPERPLTSMFTQPNSPVATGDDLRQGQRSPQEEELHKKEEKMKKEKEEKKKEESEDSSDPRPEGERRQEENSEVNGRLSPPQGDDTTSRTQEVSILDASEVTWSCSRARRFPNQSDLDVSFTPPTERINKWVAWDSEERPKPTPRLRQSTQSKSTTKLRRTSRKRKKAEGQGQSENRAEEDKPKSSSPLKRRSKMNYQESPTVLGKVASQIITQQDSSPTPLRSKGAARSVKKASTTSVSSTSSEPENTQQLAGKQPRRTKRKLYKANNHGPLDLGSPLAMVPDQEDKEGDHLIIKRKLRTRTAKI